MEQHYTRRTSSAFVEEPEQQGNASLHHLRQCRRRQEHVDRSPAVREQEHLRRPAQGAWRATRANTARKARRWTWPCWSMACRPNASRASPSMWPIGSSRRSDAASSWPIRPAMSSTRATWPLAPSTADVAVILIDARKGVLTQTRRHSRIVAMMGIRHVVLAVNKMDLVGYDQQDVFDAIVADYTAFAAEFRVRQPFRPYRFRGSMVTTCWSAVRACRGTKARA